MVRRTLNSIKRILVKEQNEILSAAFMLMFLVLITKVSGLFVQTLVAKQFGASKTTDLFYLASVVPETITNIILIGAISGSIIPIFTKIKEEKGDQLFIRSFSSTLNVSMIVFLLLSIVAAIFSKQLVPLAIELVNPQSVISEADQQEIILMMRVLLIPQILLALSAFISTALNIYQRFIIPQLAPLFFNLGRIAGILIFVPLMNGSIWGLIWGTFLGSILHFVIQLPLLKHLNINLKYLFIDLKDRYFNQVIKLGLPRIISLSAEQIAFIVDSLIAFGLTQGSLTAYQFAVRFISFPLNLFGTSYAIASFPSLSKLFAQGKKEEFSILISKLINQVLFLSIPTSILIIVLRVPFTRLVYGIFGGEFTWYDTLQVSWIILFFSIGLSFESLRSVLFRVFYSLHNSIIPLISSVFVVVLGIITGITFTNYFSHFDTFTLKTLSWNWSYFFTKSDGGAGAGGLALSSSLVFTLEFVFLIIMLKKVNIVINYNYIIKNILKKLFVGLITLIVAYGMAKLWEEVLDTGQTVYLTILTITTVIASLMFYLWTSFLFGINEVEMFITFFIKNIKRIFNL